MIVINPIALGDVACTRASSKWVYDRSGTLVQVPANTLAVTYDPSDLSKAPYALVEPAATNVVTYSESIGNAAWVKRGGCTVAPAAAIGADGAMTMDVVANLGAGGADDMYWASGALGLAGSAISPSFFIRKISQSGQLVVQHPSTGARGRWQIDLAMLGNGVERITRTHPAVAVTNEFTSTGNAENGFQFYSGSGVDRLSFGLGGVQIEASALPTSPIKTAGAPVTRAADIIAPGAGLVYSNVPIAEPAYSVGTTYAKDALAYDPTTHNVFQSLIASNVGKALTDTTAWTPRGATNRWAMFDQYNQTQTSNADEIIVVVSPQTLARGGFLGNIDALDARFSVTDLNAGVVYRETQNLMQSNSKASFYRWGFERIRRRRVTSTTKLPPYASALVTIAIRKPGGTAKCGVMALGPIIDLGIAQYGLSRGIKDWSTVQFNFDGTSNTTPRGYSKTMDLDVVLDNSQIDYVIDALEDLRQKPVAWIATDIYASAGIFGTYQDFKNVVESFPQSKMSLQIQGTV